MAVTGGGLAARPVARTIPVFARPGAERSEVRLAASEVVPELPPMLVTGVLVQGGQTWFRVLLPIRPNGRSGWVRAPDVVVVERRHRIEVDLSERSLRHYVGERLVHRFRVGVGTPRHPTPTGTFYVVVRVRYPSGGPYGLLALGLSGFSPVLGSWPGGGRLAIHGTADVTDLGRRVSHGCVRVLNRQVLQLARVPLGTPVMITP